MSVLSSTWSALAPLGVGLFAFLGGAVSSYFVFKGNKMNVAIHEKTANTQQVETIFHAYSSVVDDLHSEVDRLKELLNQLRLEQEACEERNALLLEEVEELKVRIENLER